ncbi:NUDIX domain-containing protein [Micromonospora sp. NPDC051296]|uniref:NUDIX domain-containing protein n=1 Tax=Micromonospora sp. NPDC051296 TaxID=3155046 RepID=UPI0034134057
MWEIPGGTVEPDESPADACTREVREELSLSVSAGALLCVDWVPASPPHRLDEVLIPRLARRVAAAVAAIGRGGVYQEDGLAPLKQVVGRTEP